MGKGPRKTVSKPVRRNLPKVDVTVKERVATALRKGATGLQGIAVDGGVQTIGIAGDGGVAMVPPGLDPQKASPYKMTAAGSVTAPVNQYLNTLYRTVGVDYNQTGACGYGDQECIGKPESMLNPFGVVPPGMSMTAKAGSSPAGPVAGGKTATGPGIDASALQRVGVPLPSRFGTGSPVAGLTEDAMRANVLLTTTEAVRALWALADQELKLVPQPKGGRLTLRATTSRSKAGQSLRFFVCTSA